jgi:hypothetical protein
MKSKGAIAFAMAILLVQADVASSSEAIEGAAGGGNGIGAGPEAPTQQQVEVRRRNNVLCTGLGILGGLLFGALLGSRRRGFNETAAVAGGVGTAMICHAALWRSVDRRDQDEVNRRVAAMTSDPNATSQAYTSETTRKSYTITTGETTYRATSAEFTTINEVSIPQQGAKISATPYRVTAAVLNLRASAGTEPNDTVTGAFYQGDVVESLSETADGQWVLVGYQNVGYGWVARRFLEPVGGPRDQLIFAAPGAPPPRVAAAPPAPVRVAGRRRGAAAPAPTMQLVAASARRMTTPPATRVQTVQAQMACRGFTVSDGHRSDQHASCTAAHGAILIG